MEMKLNIPVSSIDVEKLSIGDVVYISGIVYVARDMAHLKLKELISKGLELPENFDGGVIFHAGPVAKKVGDFWQIWVIGPTTSTRMEPYAEMVGKLGVKVIVGKGGMGEDTSNALKKYKGVYLLAAPGCAVIHAQFVKRVLRVHWLEELGMPEAIWVIEVENWGPLVVAMDSHGQSVFKNIREKAKAIKSSILGI